MAATGLAEDHDAHVVVYYMSRIWLNGCLAVIHKPFYVLTGIT